MQACSSLIRVGSTLHGVVNCMIMVYCACHCVVGTVQRYVYY